MSNLVIVESPSKAKTIKKYLGSDYEVVASAGHVRDLPKNVLGIDVEKNFEPQYANIKGKEDLVRRLKKAAGASDKVFLATDPDREGEAISWHLSHILGLDIKDENRVEFNEITKSGIVSGMKNVRTINMNLVNAQQARRLLDRIVGYKISPFLWRKIKKGLSAGRVQSVCVKLIVDRENEIRKFVSEEYWTIEAKLSSQNGGKAFAAKFFGKNGKKAEIKNREQVDEILEYIKGKDFVVGDVKNGSRKKMPAPPFITSTLQQESSRKLGFQSRRTMKAAQELYEGIELDGLGATGLITYMRTDSLRISDQARDAARQYIEKRFGTQYLPKTPHVYKSKKNAQDAHEAIRPTMPELSPEEIKQSLSTDQFKLYKLIWERFIASQMESTSHHTVTASIFADDMMFKATGYNVTFDGFTALYVEGKDDEDEEENTALPPLEKGEVLRNEDIIPKQCFTAPPFRYNEATLIKTLEEKGIGRPSTYAPTITTILNRNYVEREGKALKPTPLGEITTQLMIEQFESIVDVQFTATMENDLDKVEEGKLEWRKSLGEFYEKFEKDLEKAEESMKGTRMKVPDEESDEVCELCGRNMVIKTGRFGKFLACPGFPECKNTKKIINETPGKCPKCGKTIVAKKSKTGKKYFSCIGYPDCQYMTWDIPMAEDCPVCGKSMLRKIGKDSKVYCSDEACGFIKPKE